MNSNTTDTWEWHHPLEKKEAALKKVMAVPVVAMEDTMVATPMEVMAVEVMLEDMVSESMKDIKARLFET